MQGVPLEGRFQAFLCKKSKIVFWKYNNVEIVNINVLSCGKDYMMKKVEDQMVNHVNILWAYRSSWGAKNGDKDEKKSKKSSVVLFVNIDHQYIQTERHKVIATMPTPNDTWMSMRDEFMVKSYEHLKYSTVLFFSSP